VGGGGGGGGGIKDVPSGSRIGVQPKILGVVDVVRRIDGMLALW